MTAPQPVTFVALLRGGPIEGEPLRQEVEYAWPDMPPAEFYMYQLDRRPLRKQVGVPTTEKLDPTVSIPLRKHIFVVEQVRVLYRYLGEETQPVVTP